MNRINSIHIVLFPFLNIIDWMEQRMLTCPSKMITGGDCPGCGLQRSVIHLLRGEFADALIIYPAIYPMAATFGLLFYHIINGNDFTLKALKYAYFASVSTIIINYIAKLIF